MPEYKRKPNTSCSVCTKLIYRRPAELLKTNGRAYCSNKCYGIACRKETPCIICGKLILAGLNKKTCSRKCSNINRTGITYKKYGAECKDNVKTYKYQKTRLLKQRGAKCERCGFDIYQILQVHHKDRNRKHNTIKNLELLCPNCHAEEHYLKK